MRRKLCVKTEKSGKGHLISKANFQALVSPKKKKKRRLTLLRNNSSSQKREIRPFVFFGESTAWKIAFEIN